MCWGAVWNQGGECTDWPGRSLLLLQSDPSLILYCQACNISLHPFQLPRHRGLLRRDRFKMKLGNEHPLGVQNSASQMLFGVFRVYEMCWVIMPWWQRSMTWWLGYCICLYFLISFHSPTPKDKIWDFSVCSLHLGVQRRLPGSLCFLAKAGITVCSICTAWQGLFVFHPVCMWGFSLFIREIGEEEWTDRTGDRKCAISRLVQSVFLNNAVLAVPAKLLE